MFKNWIDTERLIHSFKTATACILGFLLTKIVGFPADQWIVITILVVMCAQIYVGSVLQKSYMRFLGTLAGCLFATFALVLYGENTLSIAITIGLSSFVFSYIATGQESLAYAGTLGAVTTTIIMIGQTPTVLFAAERFLEISIGILIAALISQYFLPIRAGSHIKRAQAETLKQLRDYYVSAMIERQTKKQKDDYYELDESIVKTILKQRQLAKESKRESIDIDEYNPEQFVQTLYCEKEILRAIDFMHQALVMISYDDAVLSQTSEFHLFNETIIQSLDTFIKILHDGKKPQDHIHIPSVSPLKIVVQKNAASLSAEEMMYVHGFIFSAEILTETLETLARLYDLSVYSHES